MHRSTLVHSAQATPTLVISYEQQWRSGQVVGLWLWFESSVECVQLKGEQRDHERTRLQMAQERLLFGGVASMRRSKVSQATALRSARQYA